MAFCHRSVAATAIVPVGPSQRSATSKKRSQAAHPTGRSRARSAVVVWVPQRDIHHAFTNRGQRGAGQACATARPCWGRDAARAVFGVFGVFGVQAESGCGEFN